HERRLSRRRPLDLPGLAGPREGGRSARLVVGAGAGGAPAAAHPRPDVVRIGDAPDAETMQEDRGADLDRVVQVEDDPLGLVGPGQAPLLDLAPELLLE